MESPLSTYVYSYPHKLAYAPFDPPIPLGPVWQKENLDGISLYWHIPFCEMRCGFCNLFTSVEHKPEAMAEYMRALQRQNDQMAGIVAPARAAALAIGGGTPTQLPVPQLVQLLEMTRGWARAEDSPFSVESSPATVTREKLALLKEAGVTRVSLGVQSFLPEETRAVHREQAAATVQSALQHIRDAGFPVLNIDLMTGLPGQTPETLLHSLKAALRWQPEELFVYPLYVRPFTRLHKEGVDTNPDLYRIARSYLESHGYEQTSMRMYRRKGGPGGGEYRYHDRPLLGLGCGARSYTSDLHYSSPYAVGSRSVSRILREYRETEDYTQARFGYRLDREEQQRRRRVLSLFSESGLTEEMDLSDLQREGWVTDTAPYRLTAEGFERADDIGPRFFSARVAAAVGQGAGE